MKKHIAFCILFPIVYILLSLLTLLYLDLANGPMYLLFIEIALILGFLVSSILLINKRIIIRAIPFILFISLSVFLCSISKPITKTRKAMDGKNITETEALTLKNGKVKGLYNSNSEVEVYAGIPYAKPPVGELRWKEPVPVENWDGVLDCTNFAPMSMQNYGNPVMGTAVEMYAEKGWHPDYKMYPNEPRSEDSLYLNIWRPSNSTGNLPILVYIHGGSLTSGRSSQDDYNGETMARQGIIMITIAYRLGIFGYFAHNDLISESINNTTGNYGLLDQIEALKWINENAEYFGGDKNNITIAGESAGSSSISALCVSPLAKNLFKRAIGESSSIVSKYPPHTFRSLDKALDTGNKIMEKLGCTSISELRSLSPEKLLEMTDYNSQMTIDGYAITESPIKTYEDGNNNEEALLNGYNVKEADAFVLPGMLFDLPNKDNIRSKLLSYFDETATNEFLELYKDEIEKDAFTVFNKIISLYWFYMPHYEWSTYAYNSGVKVYRYQFTKDNGYYGTYHSGELIYFYGNIGRSPRKFAYKVEDLSLSDKIVSYLVNFVKTGNPNGLDLNTWDEWTPSNNKLLELGTNTNMFEEPHLEAYAIIDRWNERRTH